jgi:hypothetical protein
VPFLAPLIPILVAAAPAITAGAAAASVGIGIDELVNKPGTPKVPTGPQPVTPQTSGAIKGAVSQEAPDITAATGGSVSPAYTLALSQLFGGTSNTPGGGGSAQGVINQLFGLGGGTGTGGGTPLTNPGSGVADFQPAGLGSSNSGGGIVDDGLSNLLQQSMG